MAMHSVQQIMEKSDFLDCEDFSLRVTADGVFHLFDAAEGESVVMSSRDLINHIAAFYAEESGDEEVEEYHRNVAVNVFANRTDSGIAWFMYGMMP